METMKSHALKFFPGYTTVPIGVDLGRQPGHNPPPNN